MVEKHQIKTEAKAIFGEYEQGNNYKSSVGKLGIFEQTKMNERFFVGDQWYGAQCGNERPLVRRNIIKRIGEYKMSAVGAAPVTVNYTAEGIPNTNDIRKVGAELQAQMMGGGWQAPAARPEPVEVSVITDALSNYQKICAERVKFDVKNEQLLRNAYVSGTGIAYTYWDDEIDTGLYADEGRTTKIKGDIAFEVLDVENVIFGDPNSDDVQSQPYILIAQRLDVETVRREARKNRLSDDDILPDGATQYNSGDRGEQEPTDSRRVTVITKLYKEWNKDDSAFKVMAVKVTEKAVVRKPWDIGLTMYPIAKFCWERRRSCAYGDSEITYLIPNQIAINRMSTAECWSALAVGMPKLVVNSAMIDPDTKITNDPGQIIRADVGFENNLTNAMGYISPPYWATQYQNAVNDLSNNTLADSGANDAALGNIRPDNAAAIIQMREAALQPIPDEDFNCNIFQHDADIYCFCSGYYEGEATPYYIYKIVDKGEFDFDQPLRITDELSEAEGGFYVPTVMINCLPMNPDEGWSYENEGILLEGYNLFGNKYKIVYSTARQYEFPDDDVEVTKDKMQYVLLSTTRNSFSGQTVTAEITYPSGKKVHHSVTLTGEYKWVQEAEAAEDGLIMEVLGVAIQFIDSNTSKVAEVSRSDYVRNNMVVTAPCPNSKENYEKVLNMTCSEWFGGGSEGIYDGIHLFMGGNTKESEKALVCWSDFDKPLYFSENGYAYVGDKAQRVTAFGKQGESLIILKERETYATQYSGSDSVIDAEAVINQSVVDVTATEVTFPMVQVHGFIGCDCPDTVQLCRNRLVWAHSDGKVYTLVSANQWNERSIFEVSAMVERRLAEEGAENLRNALSADWEGHYILSLGDRFYLMDYNSYGYANVTSYTKSEDAQLHIPWWVWEKPKYNMNTYYDAYPATDSYVKCEECYADILSTVTVGNRLYLVAMFRAAVAESGSAYYPEVLVFEGEDDLLPDIELIEHNLAQTKERGVSRKEIPAMVQTKLFDFGGATIQKSVPKAEISFGNNEGVPITVTTITDRGETSREVVLDFEETDSRNPQFFKNVVIRNGERLNNRIGYRLESNGNLFVDALSVYYKLLGGSK